MSRESTLAEVVSWPIEDQLDLASELWDRIIDLGWMPQPSASLEAELHRRLTAHKADPTKVLAWEQVVAHSRLAR